MEREAGLKRLYIPVSQYNPFSQANLKIILVTIIMPLKFLCLRQNLYRFLSFLGIRKKSGIIKCKVVNWTFGLRIKRRRRNACLYIYFFSHCEYRRNKKCCCFTIVILFIFYFNIQLDGNKHEGRGFIFHSEDAFECDRLMLIVHGSGVVRAGQWARRFDINFIINIHFLIVSQRQPF